MITTASTAPFLLIHSVILLINLLIILNAKHEELDIKIVKSFLLMYLESNRRGRHKTSLQICNNYYEVEKETLELMRVIGSPT